ncbi:MAG: hypothetical protein CSA07_02325 [Bacteroidia bacterium]|nr:MAG: hypothetical protein CSA07_02325 [Bacteroidia bacterium]
MESPRRELVNPKDARIQLTQYKLRALLDFSSINYGDFTPKVLMERFSHILNEDLLIDNVLFYFKGEDRDWELLLNTQDGGLGGGALSPQQVVPVLDGLGYRKPTIVSSLDIDLFRGFDVIIPIFQDSEARAYVLLGDNSETTRGVSPVVKHLKFAETLASICYLSLSNFQQVVKRIRQQDLQHQMEMAGKLQRVLVVSPKHLPRMPGVEYGMFYRPYFEIGGDSLDVRRLSDTMIGFCVADVSGKGIPAALMMSSFNAHFRARMTVEVSMEHLVKVLNDLVMELADGSDTFITAFIARFDTRSGVLEYVNAGQNPPALRSEVSGSLEYLGSNQVGLGMVEELPYFEARRLRIQEPSMLVCYTDGLVESRCGSADIYSTSLVEEALARYSHPAQLVDGIAQMVRDQEGSGTREVFDDVSILALHFNSNSKSPSACPLTTQ